VEELMRSLQVQGSHAAALDFVDWTDAFSKMGSTARESLGIKTPEALKGRIKGVVTDPVTLLERGFERQVANYSPDQQALLRETFTKRAQGLRADWRRNQAEMFAGGYKIRGVSVDPKDADHAQVELVRVGDESAEPLIYAFEKHGDEWYVTTDIASNGIAALQLN
jgi:hypothetical protein